MSVHIETLSDPTANPRGNRRARVTPGRGRSGLAFDLFRVPRSLRAAQRKIADHSVDVASDTEPMSHEQGRVLLEAVASVGDLPPFGRSAFYV